MKVESDLAFPELAPWEGPADAPFEIEFRLHGLDGPAAPHGDGTSFEASGQNKILFSINGLGRILIQDGRRMVFDADPNADEEAVRLHFIGTVQSVLWHQRGNLPLHGSASEWRGRAIAVAGPSGTGKSAMAAALRDKGCRLLADDLTIVDFSGERPTVLPGYQKLRLCRDACEEFHLLAKAIASAHPAKEKYVLETDSRFARAAALSDIFILSEDRPATLTIDQLDAVSGVRNLLTAIHTLNPARALGRQEQIFHAVNMLVSKVRLWRLGIPEGLPNTRDAAAAILDLVDA